MSVPFPFLFYYIMNYPPKNRFQSVPIAALYLYNIQCKNLGFKNSLCIAKRQKFIERIIISKHK